MKKIFRFLKGVKEELKKVTWISKNKLLKLTSIVLIISLLISLTLQFIDIMLQYIFRNYL